MKSIGEYARWAIIGLIFGTAVGVIARRFGGAHPADGVMAGMIAAPIAMMFVLLFSCWPDLIPALLAGAFAGALFFSVIGYFGGRASGGFDEVLASVAERAPTGALFGGIAGAWLEAGAILFKKATTGVFSLIGTVILGAFLGAGVWALGGVLGGPMIEMELAGRPLEWQLGETIAGLPVGLVGGFIATWLFSIPGSEA